MKRTVGSRAEWRVESGRNGGCEMGEGESTAARARNKSCSVCRGNRLDKVRA